MNDLRHRIKAIGDRFRASASDEAYALAQARVMARQGSATALGEIAQRAHKIAGIAPMLGFSELYGPARAVENALADELALPEDALNDLIGKLRAIGDGGDG